MLFSYPNVWNTCLIILRERGYRLFLLGPDDDDSLAHCTWNAEKDGMKFRADNPIELLGLVAIREHKIPESDTPYWWRVDGPNLVEELQSNWRKLLSEHNSQTE